MYAYRFLEVTGCTGIKRLVPVDRIMYVKEANKNEIEASMNLGKSVIYLDDNPTGTDNNSQKFIVVDDITTIGQRLNTVIGV